MLKISALDLPPLKPDEIKGFMMPLQEQTL
jgi:hypothetical protein